jgi:hypothetical protein
MSKFQVGDIVIKEYGKSPARVTYVSGNYYTSGNSYTCKYLTSGGTFRDYDSNLKLYEGETEAMTSDNKTLYSFSKDDGTVAYGHHIGTNSQNLFLIEEKVTGAIHILDKKDLEEVLPYTFSAKMGNNETHYVGTPGSVNVGDILLYTGSNSPQIAVVSGVDTKNKSARAKFKGAKIVTQEI